MSPRTLTRRPLGLALAPAPERHAPRPTMTWAEMARAEGHRPRVPETPNSGLPTPLDTRLLRALRNGPLPPYDLANRFHVTRDTLRPVIDALVAEGLVAFVPAPLPGKPKRLAVALTEAGERRARG